MTTEEQRAEVLTTRSAVLAAMQKAAKNDEPEMLQACAAALAVFVEIAASSGGHL